MTQHILPLTRRTVLTGCGAAMALPLFPAMPASAAPPLQLHLRNETLALRPQGPKTPLAALNSGAESTLRGTQLQYINTMLTNELKTNLNLIWQGMDGNPAALADNSPMRIEAAKSASYTLGFPHAGTMLCRPIADDASVVVSPLALVVTETEPLQVDHDAVMLIEEWRLRPDGSAIVAGQAPGDAERVFTVNRGVTETLSVRTNSRIRYRLINSSQRSVIAIKIENHDVRVIAIDSRPAEPYLANNSQLILGPGTRIDVVVDATLSPGSSAAILLHDGTKVHRIGQLVTTSDPAIRPTPSDAAIALPTDGLPDRLDLARASRTDLPLTGPGWMTSAAFKLADKPAFQIKRGGVAALALKNPSAQPVAFHLGGHHFRHLDRLDDGWKPYWLDTLVVRPGATERIAFLAEHPGRFAIEATATDWAAPRLVSSYLVA